MAPRFRICNNCGTRYGPSKRKCPKVYCGAAKRFSCEETDAQLQERINENDELEALLQSLVNKN